MQSAQLRVLNSAERTPTVDAPLALSHSSASLAPLTLSPLAVGVGRGAWLAGRGAGGGGTHAAQAPLRLQRRRVALDHALREKTAEIADEA